MPDDHIQQSGNLVLGYYFPAAIGLLFAGLTFLVQHAGSKLIWFLFPGILGAMAIGQNVHAFSLWIAAIVNGAFYAGLTWLAFLIPAAMRRSPRR